MNAKPEAYTVFFYLLSHVLISQRGASDTLITPKPQGSGETFSVPTTFPAVNANARSVQLQHFSASDVPEVLWTKSSATSASQTPRNSCADLGATALRVFCRLIFSPPLLTPSLFLLSSWLEY